MGSLKGAHVSKNSISLERIEIFQILFKDLTAVETSPPMGVCMGGFMDGWVDGWDQVKLLKIE